MFRYHQHGSPSILAVNYHSTPHTSLRTFEGHLRWFATHFANVDRPGLDLFLSGRWPSKRRGLMIHFDDGLLDNATIAAPLLQRYGFTGWFQVVTDYLDAPEKNAGSTMSWDHAAGLLAAGHEVCCHSATHRRLRSTLTDAEIEYEVLGSRQKMTDRFGAPPTAFCFPGGESGTYDVRAVALVKKHFTYAFPTYLGLIAPNTSPHALTRCHIESGWSLNHVRLAASFL